MESRDGPHLDKEIAMNKGVSIVRSLKRKVSLVAPGALMLLAATGINAQQGPDEPSSFRLTVMSKELLDGATVDRGSNQLHVNGSLRSTGESGGVFQDVFRLDTTFADSIAPRSELEKIGIVPVGVATFELPDGTVGEFSFGVAQIEFMGELKESRIIFGPEGVASVLGVDVLRSIGLVVDSATNTLARSSSND